MVTRHHPVFGKWRQENQKFKHNLDYVMRMGWVARLETLFQK